jgi:uncharacterized protein (DUF488 family)
MTIYTIGFAGKSGREFFETLKRHGIKRLIDIRLNNSSQLSAYTKSDSLPYFLEEICGAEYVHEPLLAPTADILDARKKHKGTWQAYETAFLALMQQREIETRIQPALFDVPAVMLCSESTPEHCHRRLVAEYLQQHWADVTIIHL